MELFAWHFNQILLFYIELSIGCWITWILKKENPRIESFPQSADLAYDNIRIHTHTHTYIYIYIYGEILDFCESDKMIKISRKVDKSNTYNGFSGNISFFIHIKTSSDFRKNTKNIKFEEVLLIKNETYYH